METAVADWSSLPRDLLVSIAKLTQLFSVEDFMAFRATCGSWNEAGKDGDCFKCVKWPRNPYFMAAHKAEYYSLSGKKRWCNSIRTECKNDRFIESRFGWILMHKRSGEPDLVYPFSGARVHLPNPQFSRSLIRRSLLSANPSETLDYILVVASWSSTAFWKPGNPNWTKIKIPNHERFIDDMVFFSKDCKLYAITLAQQVLVWDVDMDSAVLVMEIPPIRGGRGYSRTYLVESASTAKLLCVAQMGDQFLVVRLDVINRGTWEYWECKRDAIFVGDNGASFSILANGDDPVIKPNSIYFSGTYREAAQSCVYNLKNRTLERFPPFGDSIMCITDQRLWVAPSSLSWLRPET